MVWSSKKQDVTSMDDLIALIASCDLTAVQDQLIPTLHKLAKGAGKDKKLDDLLVEPTSDGRDPLDVLQPPFGYGYLIILVARCSVPNVDAASVLARIANFAANVYAEELIFDVQRVCYLAEWMREEALKLGSLHEALDPICQLFLALRSRLGAGVLTPLHRTLAYTCLQLQAYDRGVECLNSPVWDVNQQLAPITYHDHLLYHYYIGIILTARGHFEEAIQAFEEVVSAPGNATTAVQLDAYKKLVLVSYLGRGKTAKVPRYASLSVQNHFKNTYGEAYLQLSEALLENNIESSTAAFKKHEELFRTDNNLGLVERAMERLHPQIVLKLTETYVALSLAEIATHLGMEEPASPQAQSDTKRLIQGMIERGEIHAEIQPDPSGVGATVAFLPDPEPYVSIQAARLIDSQTSRAKVMGQLARQRANQLGMSKDFLQKAMSQANQGAASAGALGGMMDEEALDVANNLFGNFDD